MEQKQRQAELLLVEKESDQQQKKVEELQHQIHYLQKQLKSKAQGAETIKGAQEKAPPPPPDEEEEESEEEESEEEEEEEEEEDAEVETEQEKEEDQPPEEAEEKAEPDNNEGFSKVKRNTYIHTKNTNTNNIPWNPQGVKNPNVYYMNHTQVSLQDTFSASWFQRREEFLDMPLDRVMICEDAAWKAWEDRPEKLRMTLDYMDLSVEHLSKWWKFLTFFKTPAAYQAIMNAFLQYIEHAPEFPTPTSTPLLHGTLSMIAFQPYLGKQAADKHHNLTVTSLAATLESIRRGQLGRVVVVGLVENGEEIAQESFRLLAQMIGPSIGHTTSSDNKITKIGHLEVTYAKGSKEMAKSKHLVKNIPRAVLYGTKQALELGEKAASDRTAEENAYVTTWLGDDNPPSHWKYFYLTEPDTLLNMRQTMIPELVYQLDQGNILAPHRLQPIPHESDLVGLANKMRVLNEEDGFDEKVVWNVDPTEPSHDVCCDEHAGPDAKPGKSDYEDCGTWWYTCGFGKDWKNKAKMGDVHKRLRPYKFMKLKGGTGLTLLSGNLFGRRCFPAHNTICKPPYMND